jgi:hypothetical protein
MTITVGTLEQLDQLIAHLAKLAGELRAHFTAAHSDTPPGEQEWSEDCAGCRELKRRFCEWTVRP